ncbi:MAG: 1-acyl-sn-glycerol-3-phosphate acyltransferase [Calothrix sp. SM1_5_4]|nr:1-acyl-sn-glycerol-3-phosphate acyltransferase [Calothrix sp. SM1_5_4]
MRVQPWLRAEVDLAVPREGGRGVLVVSNHRSHLDAFILLSRIPGVRILAKSALFRIPFLALMMRSTRQIRVERGRLDAWGLAMTEVGRRLNAGEVVHVFPELTRCEPGFSGTRPFVAGPFLAAIQNDALVVPVVFKGTDRAWPKGVFGVGYAEPVVAKSLPPLRARDFANAEALKRDVQRRIEQALA